MTRQDPRSRSDPPPRRIERADRGADVTARPGHLEAHAGLAPASRRDRRATLAESTDAPTAEMAAPHPLDGREGFLRVAIWADGKAFDLASGQALAALGGPREGTTVWVDLADPSPAQVADIAKLLGLHPLIVEDIIEGNQRSKIETTDELIHIVLFSLEYTDRVVARELDLVLGPGFLLSVHHDDSEPRDLSQFRGGLEPALTPGPDQILWPL